MKKILIHWFIERLEIKGYAQRTLGNYKHCLSLFERWLKERENVTVLTDVTRQHITAYETYVRYGKFQRGKQLCNTSIYARLAAVKTFYRMLYEEKIVDENLSSFVELPKLRRSLPRQVPNEKEMNEFLNAISGKDPKSLRDRALYELLYATGLRSAEVRSLALEDVDFSQKTLFVRGKGDKDRIVPIGQWVIPYLIEYLEQGRPKLLREPTGLLFITRRGAKLDENDLIYSIRKYSKGLVFTNHMSPHGFRHACATHLLRGGADIRYIQELLGHSELSSTQVYTRIEITALKEAHGRFHPRERMLYGE